MPKISVPTPPITYALVGGTDALLVVIRKMALKDQALGEILRRYESSIAQAQREAGTLAQMIEKRLGALESVGDEVVNQTGNIVGLTTSTPKPVAAAAAVGVEKKSSHGDHVHQGLHSFVGPGGSKSGVLTFYEEVPEPAPDGVTDTFTLDRAPLAWFYFQEGVCLMGGGEDYTMTGSSFTVVAGKIPPAGMLHIVRYWA